MIANPVLEPWLLVLLGVVFSAFAIWRMIAVRGDGRAWLIWLSRLAMIVLLIVIASRPTIVGDGQGPSASGGLEVYIVVDTTSSMAADDFGDGQTEPEAQTRLDGVKADIASIVEELGGAEFSLVTFDAAAVQRVPLTSDDSAMNSAASVMRQEITSYSRGSSIDEPIDLLEGLLVAAAEEEPDQRRVLFYFGDGEQTSGSEPQSFDRLAPYLDGGAVLGYGTETGGRMLEFNGVETGEWGVPEPDEPIEPEAPELPVYIQDYSVSPTVDAVSRIDEAALQIVAEQLGVHYLHREPGQSIDSATTGIEVGELTTDEGEPDVAVELYWMFAIPFGLLVLLQIVWMSAPVAEILSTRRRP
ncbi:VWA domain-containing protein [soil metagenome]